MAALPRLDSAPVNYEKFSPEFDRWLGIFVDTLNTALQDIETELASLDARLIALGG